MRSPFDRFGSFATRRRGVVIAIYLAVTLFFAWRSGSIHLDTSLTELLPRGTPSADDLRDLLAAEETLDRLFISVRREPAGDDAGEETEALAGAAEAIASDLLASGLARDARFGVDEEEAASLVESAVEHLPVLIEPARAREAASRLRLEAVREAVAAIGRRAGMPGFGGVLEEMAGIDPLGLLPLIRLPGAAGGLRPDRETGLFLSEDGARLLIVVEAIHPPTEIDFSRRLMAEVEFAEKRARRSRPEGDRLRFDHAGGHLFALEDERRVRHDAASTSLLSLAGVALVYLFVVRRPLLWVVILVPLVLSTVWTLGLASIYPGRLNMVTVAFAAILLGIGDDAMIHMYLREREERSRGAEAGESAAAALRATGPAVTVATLTTAAAFLALSFVRFRGLAELGVVAAMGMVTLLAGVLLFFPAALAILARRAERAPGPALRLPVGALTRIHDRLAARRRSVLIIAAVLTAIFILAATDVRVSSDLRSVRGEDPAELALRRVLGPFGPSAAAETMVIIHGGPEPLAAAAGGRAAPGPPGAAPPTDAAERIERGLRDAALLEPVCREWVASGRLAACDVPSATSPPESVQRERFAALGSLPWGRAAGALVEEARAAGMDEAFFEPFLSAARRYGDFEAVRIRAEPSRFGRLEVPTSSLYFADPAEAPRLAADVRRALPGPGTRIASVALVSSDLSRIIAEDFGRAVWLVALSVALLALAAFRRFDRFLLALTPVGVGCIWTLGVIRLAGIELNLMALMGLPIVFGLGVDYGVYVVDRWARDGVSARAALEGVGPAVLVTGLTTIAGFAALLSADLAGLRSLGFAVVLGASCTLAAALLLLPLLLPRRES